ncbi:hypothetical protein FRB98_003184 [Tulasnella sp. 332]|nr:hypothetical protein FRB98_003184 [Tulasnella sp. 332]
MPATNSSNWGNDQDPSPPVSQAGTSSQHPSTNVRARVTVVCQECKRLKLKCDRRTPCGSCVKRSTINKCEYSQAASDKVDLQSVHNQQLSQSNQINAILDILGVAITERNRVARIRDAPPDFDLQIDVRTLRSRLLSGIDLSMIAQQSGADVFAGGSNMVMARPRAKPTSKAKSKAILAFSATAPTQTPSQSDDFSMDAVPLSRQSSIYGRSDKGKEPARHPEEKAAAKLRAQLALVSRVFGANSSLVVFRDSFRLWMKALGWQAEADVTSAVDMTSDAVTLAREIKDDDDDDDDRSEYDSADERALVPAPRGDAFQRLRSRHALAILASNSETELEQQTSARRNQDLLTIHLAHQLFVMPTLASSMSSPTTSPSPFGINFALFQLTSSPSALSPAALFSSPPSPAPGAPQLITPAHILSHLPADLLRGSLWSEFVGVMELHSSVSLKAMGDRVDAMFEWAEAGGSSSAGSGDDRNGETTPSPPSSASATRNGIKQRRSSTTVTLRTHQIPWPTPTLSFFAVASAAFAVGAQSYTTKLAHGFPLNDTKDYSADFQMPPPSPLPQPTLPQAMTGHHLYSLSRAALLAHKQLDVPPSLDTIIAHILCWVYRLHGYDRRKGDSQGAKTGIDTGICRELAEMIALAKVMGLSRSDDIHEQDADGEGMGIWEREMRRRVWWELSWWDSYVSDAMGQTPLIDESLYPTTLPADVNDWRFNPTSVDISSAPPVDDGELSQNTTHFVLKCQIMMLQRELLQITGMGNLSANAVEEFDEKIRKWRDTELPEHFVIDFRPTLTATKFPDSNLTAAQACDIYDMINCLLLKLWIPFLAPSSSTLSLAPRQTVETCATAAHAIIISAAHNLRLFKTTRPSRFSSYWFTRSMFLAATVLGSVLIETPGVLYAETARLSLDVAIDDIFKDPVVMGRPASQLSSAVEESSEVIWLLGHVRKMGLKLEARKGSASTGSKRKTNHSSTPIETVKLRSGFQLPYVGGAVRVASTELEIVYAPPNVRSKQRPPMAVSIRDGGSAPAALARQRSTLGPIPSRTAIAASVNSTRRPERMSRRDSVGGREVMSFRLQDSSAISDGEDGSVRTRRKTSEHVIGAQGEYVSPSSAHPPPAPSSVSGAAEPPSRRSRAGSGSSHVRQTTGSAGSARLPVIGIRDRSKPSSVKGSATPRADGGEGTGFRSTKALSSSSRAGANVSKKRSSTFQGTTGSQQGPAASFEKQASADGSRPPSISANQMPPPMQPNSAPPPSAYSYPHLQNHSIAGPSFGGHQPRQHSESLGSGREFPQGTFGTNGAYTAQSTAHDTSSHQNPQQNPPQNFRPLLNYQPPSQILPPPQAQYPLPVSSTPAVQQDYPMLSTMPEEVFPMQTYSGGSHKESSGTRGFSLVVENGPMGYDGASGPSTSRSFGTTNTDMSSYEQYTVSNDTRGMPSTASSTNGSSYLDSAMDGYGGHAPSQPQAQQPVQQQYSQQLQYAGYGVPQTQYTTNENVAMQNGWSNGGQVNGGTHPGQLRTWSDPPMTTTFQTS